MPIDIATGVAAVQELDGLVGTILKYAKRLVPDKESAGLRLSQALAQVRQSCDALDKAVTSYLVVGLSDPSAPLDSAALLDIQGGRLAAAVEEGVGGCHRIEEIYWQDLDRWFSRVFTTGTPEYQELRDAFRRLFEADMAMFYDMKEVARQMQVSADEAVALLLSGNRSGAQMHIRAQVVELQSLRKAINDVLTKIERINTELIGAGVG